MQLRNTEQFVNVIHDVLTHLPELSSNLKPDLVLLKKGSAALSQIVKVEEAKRREFSISNRDRRARDYLRHQGELKSEAMIAEEVNRRRELEALEQRLRLTHQTIQERLGKQTLMEVKGLIEENELDLKITNENERLHDAIEETNCCFRICFPCVLSSKAKSSAKIIAKLSDERKQDELKNNTEEAKINEVITMLQNKREQTLQEIVKLSRKPTIEFDANRGVVQVEARINIARSRYYSAVSEECMFHIVRVYAMYIGLLDKLRDETAAVETAKPLLHNPEEFLKSKKLDIDNLVREFYCPNLNNTYAFIFYEKFNLLDKSDQAAILNTSEPTVVLIKKLITLPAATLNLVS